MIDYGGQKTDLAVKRAEWRLSRVYHQAARDIEEKLKAWEKAHAEREKKYRQQVKDGKITQDDFDAWMRGQVFQGKQWKARQEQIRQTLLNADREAARIVNDGKLGVFADNANYIGYGLEHDANINTGFMLYDQQTVARLIKSDPQILPKPAPGVQKDKAYTYYNKLMNSAITQGIVQGETIPQIAKRIAQTTGESSYKSAVRNARTAYTGAQNAGRIEGLHQAQRLGIKVKKRWMATLDSRTRDAHAGLDGQVQEVDDPFKSELGDIMFPGDPTAEPSNTYNCRCTLVYAYPDYPSDMQRRDAETGEIVGDMTYREWEAMKAGNVPSQATTTQPNRDIFKNTRGIDTTFQQGMADTLNNSSSAEAQALYTKYADELVCVNPNQTRGAYFKASSGGIHMNTSQDAKGSDYQEPYEVSFHEFGHMIDWIAGGKDMRDYLSNTPINGQRLLSVIKSDFQAFKKSVGASKAADVIPILSAEKMDLKVRANISDILEKCTGKSYPLGIGHGVAYHKRDGATEREFFAEVLDSAVANRPAYDQMKRLFPNAVDMVWDMVRSVI